jgi:NAD(P)-dependent dehydrogenase (short-subunit alcohol dehydrogenase family)
MSQASGARSEAKPSEGMGNGAVAVVTGASRGIGKGCALELGALGATVYITGRTVEAGKHPLPGTVGATADEVTKIGGRGIAVACDHRDDDAVARLFEGVADEQQGRLDVLVNNAFLIPKELTSGKPFWECPLSNWNDMVGVGTRSAYVASWHAAKLMVPRKRGLIASVSSSGAQEYAWHVAYGVGKCALDRFTSDAARELREHGIAVVSVWPGLVLTERLEGAAKAGIPGLDFSKAESPRFTGRAIAALATDAEAMQFSGRAVPARTLAEHYGFKDVDGRLPGGPLEERPWRAGEA